MDKNTFFPFGKGKRCSFLHKEKRTKRFTKTPIQRVKAISTRLLLFFRKEREQKPVLSSKKHPLGVPAIKQYFALTNVKYCFIYLTTN